MAARNWAAILGGLAVGACSVVGIRSGTEELPYRVVATPASDVEVRAYPPRLAADVTVTGDEVAARTAGFRKLAAFIFGGNQGQRDIAMTAPVAQGAVQPATIAMTAPVTQTPAGTEAWRIRFFMPRDYTAATLPKPTDPDIRVVELPATTLAAVRFAGVPTPDAVVAAETRLRHALDDTPWTVVGEPETFFYDPPWTLPFLRRNEVALPVAPASGKADPNTSY